ncbi:hypothetical protein P7K49_002692 [Saguinus oedipus]|uniref:Uncharacterized protein n=1 Tax=Saguinus oedipus TaxID=9490 RepID=A0ABQ9WI47_SAGOE|nr:hypothetical protein P7K49_002692 [Saguinus oedipus]
MALLYNFDPLHALGGGGANAPCPNVPSHGLPCCPCSREDMREGACLEWMEDHASEPLCASGLGSEADGPSDFTTSYLNILIGVGQRQDTGSARVPGATEEDGDHQVQEGGSLGMKIAATLQDASSAVPASECWGEQLENRLPATADGFRGAGDTESKNEKEGGQRDLGAKAGRGSPLWALTLENGHWGHSTNPRGTLRLPASSKTEKTGPCILTCYITHKPIPPAMAE